MLHIDVCTLSTAEWVLFVLIFSIVGLLIGLGIAAFLQRRLTGPSAHRYEGAGCVLPPIAGVAIGNAVFHLLPSDPCGEAFTSDSIFLPVLAPIVVTIIAWAAVWIVVGRRGRS